jgi:hypothetical protein
VQNEINHVKPLLRPKQPTTKTTKTAQYTENTRKMKRSAPEREKERFLGPVRSGDFKVNKLGNLSPQKEVRANILYKTIACSDSTREIPEDIEFGDLMKKSYPWAPFPVESLPGWRANKIAGMTIADKNTDGNAKESADENLDDNSLSELDIEMDSE